MKYLVRSNSAFIIALFCLLLVASLLISPAMADEQKITVPISQVVKTDKLSAEQLTKAKVTVPISWVSEEYLEEHGYTVSSQQTEEEPVTAPNNIPDGTYTREPKITSDQNDSIEISDFHFEFTYEQGDLQESTVNFTVSSNDGQIEEVDLLLEGRNTLTPLDGDFNSSTEKFSATLDDLSEGRLYRGKIEISTVNSSDTVGFEVYPRQFLNIADDDDIRIGAHYYIWHSKPGSTLGVDWQGEYRSLFEPSLGKYSSVNDEVIAKHIDWATGHGIDAFIITWWGNYDMKNRLENYLKNPLSDEIDYSILWACTSKVNKNESGFIDFSQEAVKEKFMEDMEYVVNNLINDQNYFELEGDPVIYLYNEDSYIGPLQEIFKDVENLENAPDDIFWIGDNESPFESQKMQRKAVKGINDYNPLIKWAIRFWEPAKDFNLSQKNVKERYMPFLQENYFDANEKGKFYIPTIIPGFNKPSSNLQVVKRSPEGFRSEIEEAKKVIDEDINTIFLTSFNEWPESTAIEPSEEWGFKYLDILKEELAGYEPKKELKDELDHIEFRYNKAVEEKWGRKISVKLSKVEFFDSRDSWDPEFEINIGSGEHARYLGRGWYAPEKSNGRTSRWSSSSGESSIFIPKSKDLNHMKFEAIPISDGIEADVYLNGKLVDHIDFKRGWQTYTVKLS